MLLMPVPLSGCGCLKSPGVHLVFFPLLVTHIRNIRKLSPRFSWRVPGRLKRCIFKFLHPCQKIALTFRKGDILHSVCQATGLIVKVLT